MKIENYTIYNIDSDLALVSKDGNGESFRLMSKHFGVGAEINLEANDIMEMMKIVRMTQIKKEVTKTTSLGGINQCQK